jgi:hypothetical protein
VAQRAARPAPRTDQENEFEEFADPAGGGGFLGGFLRAGRRVVSAEPSASGRAARTRFLTEKD